VPFNYQQEQGSITLSAIHRLYRRNVRVTLYKLIEKGHPAKMAWVYPSLSPNKRRDILKYIQRMDEINNFLDGLDHALVPEIFEKMHASKISDILSNIPAETTVKLLKLFTDNKANHIQNKMDAKDLSEVDKVLQYEDDSAGQLMSHEFVTFNETLSTKNAISQFQYMGDTAEMPFYFYVLDSKKPNVWCIIPPTIINPPSKNTT